MSRDNTSEKVWAIRDVPDSTRRAVRVYAAMRDISLAEALGEMVEQSGPVGENEAVLKLIGRLAADAVLGTTDAPDKFWVIRGVPEHTRLVVKDYAFTNELTMAEALGEMVGGYLRTGVAGEPERLW